LAFSAPSMALGRCRPGLRGVPGPVVARQPKLLSTSPRELDLPSRALEGAPGRLAPTPTLVGFVRVPPLRRFASRASTPGSRGSLRPDGATRRTCSAFVVSHHHDGLLRSRRCGFIAPRYRPGVRRVSRRPVARTVRPEGQRAQVARVVPRDAVHTLRRLPSPTAVPHHCSRCPPAVTVAARSRDMAEAMNRSRYPLDRGRASSNAPTPKRLVRARVSEETFDTVMLRSAEADPHVTEHRRLPRRRGVAWPLALNLRSRRRHRGASRGWGRSSHRRGWPTPTVLSGPSRPPEGGPPGCLATEAAGRRVAGSARRSGREPGSSNKSRSGRLQGFAPPTSPSCRTRRCQRNDTRSFHGLCAPSRLLRSSLRSSRAEPAGRPLRPNRGSTSAGPVRVVPVRRTAPGRRAIEIPPRVAPLCRAEARLRGAAGGPKPSPTAAPFQRGRGTPVGASLWLPLGRSRRRVSGRCP
jgi:hypothetical protein